MLSDQFSVQCHQMKTGMSSTRAVVVFWSLDGLFPHLFAATGFSNWDMCTMHVHETELCWSLQCTISPRALENLSWGWKTDEPQEMRCRAGAQRKKCGGGCGGWSALLSGHDRYLQSGTITVTVTTPANTCRQCLLSPHWHGRWWPGSGIDCSILCLPCSNAARMGMRTSGLQKYPAPSICSAAWTIANSLHLSYPS